MKKTLRVCRWLVNKPQFDWLMGYLVSIFGGLSLFENVKHHMPHDGRWKKTWICGSRGLWVKCFHVNPPSFLPFHPFKRKIPFLPSLLTPFVKKSPSVSAVINLHPWRLSIQVSSSLWIPCVSALTLRNPSPKTYCPVGPQRCNFWSFLVVNFFWSEENMKITFCWVGCENVEVVLSVWYLYT